MIMTNQIKKLLKRSDFINLCLVKQALRKNKQKEKADFDIAEFELNKYQKYYERTPDIENPKRISELMFLQKLYFYDKRAVDMTDKIKCKTSVRKFTKHKLNFAKTYRTYEDANEINLNDLPDDFVLKCNHNSGYIFYFKKNQKGKYIIINLRDPTHKKYRFKTVKKILNVLLKMNYFYNSYEWNYKDIERKIFAEEYLDNECLKEYKIYCSDGILLAFHIVSNRHISERNDFFDSDLKPLDVWADVPPSDVLPKLSSQLEKMLEIAKDISKGFPFVRIDLYDYKEKIYFGETTFFHQAGYLEFKYPDNLDEILGKNIELSNELKQKIFNNKKKKKKKQNNILCK